jgi:hypothetical protein
MLIKELLDEVLNTKFDFNIITSTGKILKASTEIGEATYTFTAYMPYTGAAWDFEFSRGESGYELSNTGDEFKVFSVARQFFDLLMTKKNPEKIYFSGAVDEGRERLYKKFALYLSRQYNLKLNTREYEDEHQYTLSKV